MVKINEFHDMEVDKDNPLFAPLPYDLGEDLMIFMRNDPMFYRRHFFPISDHIKLNSKNIKAIDHNLIDNMINKGVLEYCKKYKIPHDPSTLIDKGERSVIAGRIIKDELQQ